MTQQKTCIAFAGGGSGGHIYPLIAIAREIKKQNSNAKIYFVSTRGSIEEKLVPKEGFSLQIIPSGKFNGQNPIVIFVSVIKVIIGFIKSLFIFLNNRPQYVMSAGGYAGAPFFLLCSLLGVPTAIMEQNRVPGMANRFMAKFCKTIFLHFSDTVKYFPKHETHVVGHPFREEILKARWTDNMHWTENPFSIFIFGGSQGARAINYLVAETWPLLKDLNLKIHHQTGTSDYEDIKKLYGANNISAKIEPYIYDMTSAYRDAHLVICRAGASSLAEISAASKAAILIPLVSRDNHQEPNAAWLAEQGAALFLKQKELDAEKLAQTIRDLYLHRERLQKLSDNIKKLCHPDSAKQIVQRILG